jgi:hypothetical protein
MSGDLAGIQWRIVQGRKSPDDLRLEIRCTDWVPPTMALGFLFADFYAQNEETLRQDGYLRISSGRNAGERYLNFIKGAMFLGWKAAYDQLMFERRERRERAA